MEAKDFALNHHPKCKGPLFVGTWFLVHLTGHGKDEHQPISGRIRAVLPIFDVIAFAI